MTTRRSLHRRDEGDDSQAIWEQAAGGAASFDPSQLPQLTAWLNWAGATDTGTLSVPDLKGGSPATQSTGGLKPTVDRSGAVAFGAFSSSLLALPLSAAINDTVKFGVAFWLKMADVTGTKGFIAIQNVAGGANADKLQLLLIGNVLQVRAMSVDRRAQFSPLDTNRRFVYLGIDCSKGTEATQVLMGLDAALQSLFFSSDTAWPATLGAATGNMLIGAASLLVASIGDIYFFSDQLTVADQGRLMNFNPPF